MKTYGPRTRVFLDYRSEATHYQVGELFGSPWQSGPIVLVTDRQSDIMSDVVTKDFQKNRKAGAIVNNPMRRVVDRSICGRATVSAHSDSMYNGKYAHSWSKTNEYEDHFGGWANTGGSLSPDTLPRWATGINEARMIAKQACLANVDRTPLSFAEDLAEAASVLRTLRQPWGNLGEVADTYRLKFGRYEKMYTKVRAHSKAWLHVRFALRPILISTENMWKVLTNEEKMRKRLAYAKQTRRRSTVKYSFSDDEAVSGSSTYFSGEYERSVKLSGRVGILYQISNPIDEWYEIAGLRWKEAAQTAWDVIPYAWAIDRFYNVHDMIRGLQNLADPTIKVLAAWDYHLDERTDICLITRQGSPGWSTNYVPVAPSVRLVGTKVRDVWVPNYLDTAPTFHGVDVSEVANLTDLLAVGTLALSKFFRPTRRSII